MTGDDQIAVERVQSEAFGALASIQSYRDLNEAYFDRFRQAVINASAYFQGESYAPSILIDELTLAARVLRNEATAFPGRTVACMEMAEWLDRQRRGLPQK
ncbi:hypothetical protein [Sphingomonas sp. PB4P5]|uniref:hypothetical protein n=1 Tax=Parasphingomonas puruogangriensis TaxID=3096155 RepID=UPI002FC9C7BA